MRSRALRADAAEAVRALHGPFATTTGTRGARLPIDPTRESEGHSGDGHGTGGEVAAHGRSATPRDEPQSPTRIGGDLHRPLGSAGALATAPARAGSGFARCARHDHTGPAKSPEAGSRHRQPCQPRLGAPIAPSPPCGGYPSRPRRVRRRGALSSTTPGPRGRSEEWIGRGLCGRRDKSPADPVCTPEARRPPCSNSRRSLKRFRTVTVPGMSTKSSTRTTGPPLRKGGVIGPSTG